MPVTLTAANCPIPTRATTCIDPAAATPLVAQPITAGMTTALLAAFNTNAAQLDAIGRAGAGCYGVAFGLGLSAGSGLTLNVAAGQAVLDGPRTLPSGATLGLSDNTARVYVWLSQAGALLGVNNSLAAPAGTYVFLGSAVTSGGAITSVDSSGVVFLRCGTPWRQTADTSTPGDAPYSDTLFFTRTTNAVWLWDGSAYAALPAYLPTSAHFSQVSKTGNYTATADDTVVLCDTSGGGFTVTLPASVDSKVYVVKKISTDANTVTVATTGGQNIDGATTAAITAPYASIDLIGTGSAWWIF